jgi:hypothetical protein
MIKKMQPEVQLDLEEQDNPLQDESEEEEEKS